MYTLDVQCSPNFVTKLIVAMTYELTLVWEAFKKKWAGSLGTETSTCMSEVLALAVEAFVLRRYTVVNGCLVKFPGLCCEPVLHVLLDAVIQDESFAHQSLFLGDQKWCNRRERCGLYGGWPRTSHLNFCKSAMIVLVVWGLALSSSRMTPWVSLRTRIEMTKSPVETSRVTTTKKSKAIHTSAGKVMLTFFFNQDGPLLIDFLQRGTTVNAQRCSQTLTTLRQGIKSK